MSATPCDGDGALLDDVAEEVRRRLERDAEAVAVALDGADAADAVDVTLDVVAAERLPRASAGSRFTRPRREAPSVVRASVSGTATNVMCPSAIVGRRQVRRRRRRRNRRAP